MNDRIFRNFCELTVLLALACVPACDRLTAPESRELAGGYRLQRVKNSPDLALITPHQNGGLIVDEIGWHKPFIVARASGSRYWDVINTTRAEHTRINDQVLKSDAMYRSIEIVPAEKAWGELKPDSKIWP